MHGDLPHSRTMKTKKIRINELAPCGVYCAACPSFHKSCNGCASQKQNQQRQSKFYCKIRLCCYEEKQLNFCSDCDQFPCQKIQQKLVKSHPGDLRFTYRHEILTLAAKLKSMTLNEQLEFRKKRWRCNSCGGTIHFYHYKCDRCGKEQIIR